MYHLLSETIISTNRKPEDLAVSSFSIRGETAFVFTVAIGSFENLKSKGYTFEDFGTGYYDASDNFCVVPNVITEELIDNARYATQQACDAAGCLE